MGMGVSRRTAALTALFVIAAIGLWFFLVPGWPKVAAAGPHAGIPGACSPGSRTGRADLYDNLQTSDQLTITVRTPSDYDPTRAYPLLVVFPPAGYERRGSELFYGLTPEATGRGFIVAYSDHVRLSPSGVAEQAKVAATVASLFCVDETAIAYLGHSDGGLMAEGIPAYISKGVTPRSIVASAAGITGDDLAAMACPSIASVLIVHSRTDERFPEDYGHGAAAYWGRCAACAPADLTTLADGCRDFTGCAQGRRVTYCQTSLPHKRWPSMNAAMLDFIQGGQAKMP